VKLIADCETRIARDEAATLKATGAVTLEPAPATTIEPRYTPGASDEGSQVTVSETGGALPEAAEELSITPVDGETVSHVPP
jgi:hypothetical protein